MRQTFEDSGTSLETMEGNVVAVSCYLDKNNEALVDRQQCDGDYRGESTSNRRIFGTEQRAFRDLWNKMRLSVIVAFLLCALVVKSSDVDFYFNEDVIDFYVEFGEEAACQNYALHYKVIESCIY